MRLTDSKVKSLKPQDTRYIVWEDGRTGLGIRVGHTGRRSFIYMYKYEGRARMMTIGSYPRLSLANARAKVADARLKLESGTDPGVAHIEAKMSVKHGLTVRQLCNEFLEKWSKPNKRSWEEDERILNKDIIPAWGPRKAWDIKRRDVILLLDEIVDRGAPVSANRCLALLTKMFSFGVKRDIINGSPCVEIDRPTVEKERDRVLTDEEIEKFWNGVEQSSMHPATKIGLQLMLATGQRKSEVVGARWDEFDFEEKTWELPGSRTKNKKPHIVPLSPFMLKLLSKLKMIAGKSEWLFPSPRGDKPMTPRAVSRAMSRAKDEIGLADCTPHDLRRSVASNLTKMKFSRLVVSMVLNHEEGGITRKYDRYSYLEERQQALNDWGRKLDSIITDKKSKILELRKCI